MSKMEFRPPPVVIDGRNVAGYSHKTDGWQWQFVIDAATFHQAEGSQVHVVIPNWMPKEFLKPLQKVAEIIKFSPTSGKDKEGDDKLALGRTALIDGFIITNDKKIGKHTRGDLLTREWCASHRIGFRFDEGVYAPMYPMMWKKSISNAAI
tara:strand:+ start:1172 stop:1624 length:453 start_codon:yes stop_codon:yes gene_type:complete